MKHTHGMSRLSVNLVGELWKTDSGYYHRYDGPYRTASDKLAWAVGGLTHRLDGPSFIYVDGSVTWSLNDRPSS